MTFKIPQEEALLGERELRNVKFKKQNEGYASSTQADQGSVIEFIPMHFKNTPVITFLAFLDDIKDNIKQTFTPQQPYGRSDPIQVWKSSDRVITLSFKIPSSSEEMGLRNINNLSWLLASSYPTYDIAECANSVAATPLYRVKFANIIANTNNNSGLLCAIPGFNVVHDFKEGVIHIHSAKTKKLVTNAGFPTQAGEIIVAKTITVSCTLNVLHEHSLGWDATTGEWRGSHTAGYPYGFGLLKDAGDPASKGPGGTAESSDTGGATAKASAGVEGREQAASANANFTDKQAQEFVYGK